MSVPLELSNKSVSLHYRDKSYFFNESNSFLFYGFIIKNKYDEERLKICSHLSPVRIKNTIKSLDGEQQETFYYGVILPGNKLYNDLVKCLPPLSLTLDSYRRIFSEFNIETNDNYLYYNMGIYPFDDIKKLHNGIINSELFYLDTNIPFYQRMASIKPFIFCRTNDECN